MQKSIIEVLKHLVDAYKSFDAQWAEQSKEFDRQYRKGQDLNPWGLKVQKAILDLEQSRCDELTVLEIAALMLASQKTAERKLKIFLDTKPEGSKAGEGAFHAGNKHLGRYERWHYHRDPFQRFLEEQDEQLRVLKSANARAAWKSSKGVALRQGKQRNETRRQADIFADAAQLAADRLAGQPDLAAALKVLAKSHTHLKAQGIQVEVKVLPAFAAFVDAQTQDIAHGVSVPQPWLTDAKGRIVDHAGWPLTGAGAIRTVLAKGGTVESMPLMTALKRVWKPGNAFSLWINVAQLSVDRWQMNHDTIMEVNLATNRTRDSMGQEVKEATRKRKRS